MTDPKQFICSFLGIPETDFAEVVINSRMMLDMLQAYEEILKKNEFGQPMFHPATTGLTPEFNEYDKDKDVFAQSKRNFFAFLNTLDKKINPDGTITYTDNSVYNTEKVNGAYQGSLNTTNDTQTEYGNKFSQPPTDTKLPILFADTESKNIMVKKTDGSIVEIEPIDPSSETKYPNLLNATKADITTNDLQKDYNRPRNWINPLED